MPLEKLQLSTILFAEDNSEISAFPEQEQIELLPNGEYRFLRNRVQILGGYWMYLCTEDGYCYLRTVSGRTATGEEMLYKENDTSLVGINVYDENDTLIRTYGYIPVDSFSSIPMPEFQEKYKSVYADGEKMWSYFEDAAISTTGRKPGMHSGNYSKTAAETNRLPFFFTYTCRGSLRYRAYAPHRPHRRRRRSPAAAPSGRCPRRTAFCRP